jgi:flavodoxin
MNILVAYYSETGNTRKIAETIFAALRHTRKKLLAIDQVVELDTYDLIFCGTPVQNHSIPAKMVHFFQEIPKGKKLAIFLTHGSLRGGEKAVSALYHALSLSSGQVVIGTFGCRGQVKPQMIDLWMDAPQHQAWAREAQSAIGHPDAADLEDAREFAETMLYAAEHIHGSGNKPANG